MCNVYLLNSDNIRVWLPGVFCNQFLNTFIPGTVVKVKEESLEDQIDYLLTYAKLNNDTDAAIKVIHLEALLLERDTKIALPEEKPSTSSLAHSVELPVSCS